MKKIGIITHYYKSINYGGNLQAYALCRCLNSSGYNAEQICFSVRPIAKREKFLKQKSIKGLLKLSVRLVQKILIEAPIAYLKRLEDEKKQVSERRFRAFENFNNQLTPNSKIVYRFDNISDCLQNYSAFITGSDQVWNFAWYNPACFLDFVPSDKIKLSYAASIARDSLTEEQKDIFRKSLKDYKAISVREKSAEKLLEGLAPVSVQTVLDPTLLLTREEWDEVCAERVIEEDYVFCYFLGDNKKERRIAKQFAQKQGLNLVALPHTAGIKLMDRNFGDERLYDASPEQFLSLIKHAKYVFTDSFHAVVFSNIYQKQYFVFHRSAKGEMSSRIVDITQMFGQTERFCAGKERESIAYVASLADIDYTKENPEFDRLKKDSIAFLENNLKD